MGIEIKNNIDFSKIKNDLVEGLEDNLARALEDIKTEIKIRTRSMRGADGQPFDELTPKYKKYKENEGRRGVPDLTFSGQMLSSITTVVRKYGKTIEGRIFFNSAKQALKAKGNQRIRRFFALSREQAERLVTLLKGR